MPQPSGIALSILLILVALASESCRNRRRSVDVASSAPKVSVTLVNVEDTYKGDPALGYKIVCGNTEWVTGKSAGEGLVDFHVKGLKAKDTCSVNVLHLSPPENMKFLQQKGVLYGSDPFVISTSAVGQLVGTAYLGPQYQFESKGISLTIPVQFKGDIPADSPELRAKIVCDPDVDGISEKMKDINTKEKIGKFQFTGGIIPKKKHVCGTLFIYRGSKFVFSGDFGESFTLTDGQNVEAKKVTVEALDISTAAGITIITKAAGSCRNGEIFDIATRSCVPEKS